MPLVLRSLWALRMNHPPRPRVPCMANLVLQWALILHPRLWQKRLFPPLPINPRQTRSSAPKNTNSTCCNLPLPIRCVCMSVEGHQFFPPPPPKKPRPPERQGAQRSGEWAGPSWKKRRRKAPQRTNVGAVVLAQGQQGKEALPPSTRAPRCQERRRS